MTAYRNRCLRLGSETISQRFAAGAYGLIDRGRAVGGASLERA